MDIHAIRQQLRTKSIYDIPMRVTFYARVSSESDEQLNSLGNQITYYQDLIQRNRSWTFVPGYIDEGLSGISTKKRENFNRMVEDAALDKFDLVITKEISRFARNVWGISEADEERAAQAGIRALEDLIQECGLPTRLGQLNSRVEITPELLRQVANSTNLLPNGYRQLTHDEVYDILAECL